MERDEERGREREGEREIERGLVDVKISLIFDKNYHIM